MKQVLMLIALVPPLLFASTAQNHYYSLTRDVELAVKLNSEHYDYVVSNPSQYYSDVTFNVNGYLEFKGRWVLADSVELYCNGSMTRLVPLINYTCGIKPNSNATIRLVTPNCFYGAVINIHTA